MILFSLMILLLKLVPAQAPKISGYEYWYDDNYSSHVYQPVTPAVVADVNTLFPASSLSAGIHKISFRFKDDHLKNAIPSSFLFYKPASDPSGGMITGYEYWFDQNYGAKVSISTGNIASLDLATLFSTASLGSGLHALNFRVKGTDKPSIVTSSYFYKSGPEPSAGSLSAYEYWFDDNYAAKVVTSLGNVPVTDIMVNLNSSGLSKGLHTLHFRVKGSDKSTYATANLFYKSEQDIVVRNLTAYEFWFDDDPATMDTLQMQLPLPFRDLLDTLKTTYLPIGLHKVNYRFRDSQMLHSAVLTDEFQVTNCMPYGAGPISGLASIRKGQTSPAAALLQHLLFSM